MSGFSIRMWITGLFGLLGQAIGGLFGMKKEQGEIVGKAIDSLQSIANGDSSQATATAAAINSLYQYGNILERSWRPLLMYLIIGMLVARWFFGYVPPFITTNEVDTVYRLLEMGLIGYMPLRSLDKWMTGFQIGSVLKTFISKKLV